MFIIIKKEQTYDTIVNIINNDEITWIEKYMENEITKLKYIPNDDPSRKNIDYFTEIVNGEYHLIKQYDIINYGFLYNSVKRITERVFTIKYMIFDASRKPNKSNKKRKRNNNDNFISNLSDLAKWKSELYKIEYIKV